MEVDYRSCDLSHRMLPSSTARSRDYADFLINADLDSIHKNAIIAACLSVELRDSLAIKRRVTGEDQRKLQTPLRGNWGIQMLDVYGMPFAN